jgi:hypothetical protein
LERGPEVRYRASCPSCIAVQRRDSCDTSFLTYGDIEMAAAAAALPAPLAGVPASAASVPNAPVRLSYGTAGFRARAELLDAVFLRMGMLAALRAWQTGKVRGVQLKWFGRWRGFACYRRCCLSANIRPPAVARAP